MNIDISKPVSCSLTLTVDDESMEFYLSYEGVHEVCPLCGGKDHSLVSYPNKPRNNLDLMVAKLESSTLDSQGQPSHSPNPDWIHVKPQRRARPKAFGGGGG